MVYLLISFTFYLLSIQPKSATLIDRLSAGQLDDDDILLLKD